MHDIRRLMNVVRDLCEDSCHSVDESFDAPAAFQLKTFVPAVSKWAKGVKSLVDLPDGTVLYLQATRRGGAGYWEVGFARSHKHAADEEDDEAWHDSATGQGSQHSVFATVVEFVRLILDRFRAREIRFGVETASGRGDRRASLYHQMARRFAGPMGYRVVTQPDPKDPQSTLFRLIRHAGDDT